MDLIKAVFVQFWKQYPAILYGLSALLASGFALSSDYIPWFPTILLFLTCLIARKKEVYLRLGIALVLGLSTFYFIKATYLFPEVSSEGIQGTAIIEISSLSSAKRHYGKIWIYKCTLKSFIPDGAAGASSIGRQVPLTITLIDKDIHRPLANRHYQLHGILKKSAAGSYSIQVAKNKPWFPLKDTWSFAEWRYQLKKKVKDYLHRHITNPQSAVFLQGIATGEFDDNLLFFEFSRFGLQHIMAISGFHFAIVASILSIILRLMMSKKGSTYLLIFLLSSYFLFLGCTSSIMRAWLTILIALGGSLIERRSFGLNSLGAALLFVVLFDPLMSLSVGFQLSFITTAAILMLHPLCDTLLQKVYHKRSLGQVITMDSINQHGYCILVFMRQALALTVAVNLIALPMTLYYFHKFPWMSIVYNLFFPFLVSFSMLLLLIAIPFSMILPPIAEALHSLNNLYTQMVLNFTYNMPMGIDFTWRISNFSSDGLVVYLSLIFFAAVILRYYFEKQQEEFQDFIFV